jgi:hypothetical protein
LGPNGSRSAHFTGLKIDQKAGRPFHVVAGPNPSPTGLRLASLPLDLEFAARLDRVHAAYLEARAKAKRAAARKTVIKRRHLPVNVLGGYRFPNAPSIDLSPIEAPEWASASRWIPTGAGAGMPPIPSFLQRHPTYRDAVAALRSAARGKGSKTMEKPTDLDRFRNSKTIAEQTIKFADLKNKVHPLICDYLGDANPLPEMVAGVVLHLFVWTAANVGDDELFDVINQIRRSLEKFEAGRAVLTDGEPLWRAAATEEQLAEIEAEMRRLAWRRSS